MSFRISTLLIRNLHEVFGENDPALRRAAINEIFAEDCVFYEPRGVHRGRDEIDRVAGAIKATHPDFCYQPIAEPEELGNSGRIQWVSGRPGEAPVYAGTDFIIARDGQIAAVYLFFDKLPSAAADAELHGLAASRRSGHPSGVSPAASGRGSLPRSKSCGRGSAVEARRTTRCRRTFPSRFGAKRRRINNPPNIGDSLAAPASIRLRVGQPHPDRLPSAGETNYSSGG